MKKNANYALLLAAFIGAASLNVYSAEPHEQQPNKKDFCEIYTHFVKTSASFSQIGFSQDEMNKMDDKVFAGDKSVVSKYYRMGSSTGYNMQQRYGYTPEAIASAANDSCNEKLFEQYLSEVDASSHSK